MTRLTITPQGNSYRVYNHASKTASYINEIIGIDVPEDTRQLKMEIDEFEFTDHNTLVIE